MNKSHSNPDRLTAEKRRKRKAQVEQKIIEVETWLMSHLSDHQEWTKQVQELHSLGIQQYQLEECALNEKRL